MLSHSLSLFFFLSPKKSMLSESPTYSDELLNVYTWTQNLWSQSDNHILSNQNVSQNWLTIFFIFEAPFLWNALPGHIRNIDSINKLENLIDDKYFMFYLYYLTWMSLTFFTKCNVSLIFMYFDFDTIHDAKCFELI